MSHWSDRVEKVLLSRTNDLRELARIAGFDAETLYVGQSLAGCDLRGQDLRGIDLTGCNFDRAILDSTTKIDLRFDPRIDRSSLYLTKFRINSDINAMIIRFMEEKNIAHVEWAHSRLINGAILCINTNKYEFYSSIINCNSHLSALLTRRPKLVDAEIKFKMEWSDVMWIFNLFGSESQQKVFPRLLMVGLLRHRIRSNSKKDYSNLSPNAFYPPPRLLKLEGGLRSR